MLLAGFRAEIVAGRASRAADERAGEGVAADGIGKQRACRGTGKAALEIGVDTACKAEKRREGESEEFSMHWRLPFCVFDLVKQSPARRG